MPDPISWPNNATLETNHNRLVGKLKQRLNEYEARYEIKSEQLSNELTMGRIRETAEICDWMIAFHTYQLLQHG